MKTRNILSISGVITVAIFVTYLVNDITVTMSRVLLGVATGLMVGGLWTLVKHYQQKSVSAITIALEPGEHVLRAELTDRVHESGMKRGKLVLTNRREIFKPCRFTAQTTVWSLFLRHVVGRRGTKALGLADNMLLVRAGDGIVYRITVEAPRTNDELH